MILDATSDHVRPRLYMIRHFVLLLTETTPDAFAEPAATDPDVIVALTDGRLTATVIGDTYPEPT
jgi:hypothetical protein